MPDGEMKEIEEALTEIWSNYQVNPDPIYVGTPYGGLCLGRNRSFMFDDDGNPLEDQTGLEKAMKWFEEQVEKNNAV